MLLENALLAALNPPHPSRISELDTELSAYASGLGDLESINDFAEDSSRETGAKGGSILPFSRLDSAASVTLPSNLQRRSDPSCSTTSGTEPRHNTFVDKQNDNYSTTSLTGGFENKIDAASAERWGDKYTEGDWRITNDGKIDSIITTTESTLSLASLTTTCSSGDSSNVLSSIDIMQVDVKRGLSRDDDNQDQPLHKRRKGSPITSTDREQYKFACPFRKYNPAKYGIQHRSGICALSQWDCISRLKEHLYRCHMAPQQCLRCGDTFKTAGDLESHSKRPVACDPKSAVFPEGITPAIYQILKSRKKLTRGQSEEERWKDIYKVLFPMANDIPKPYFEPIQEEPAQALLENYENFSSRQLPRLLRYYLEKDLSSLLSGSRNLTEELVGLMEHCHAKILESYRSQYWNDSMTSTSFYKAPTALTPVTVPPSRTTTPMSTLAHNELCSPTSLETGFKGSLNNHFEPFELLEKLSEDELY